MIYMSRKDGLRSILRTNFFNPHPLRYCTPYYQKQQKIIKKQASFNFIHNNCLFA
ncbi:hypothetical protein MGG_17099 [Pyricularia oryzae 70-15]|uniref:Uncharacterized protein n=1 Tax=Pyricularia oryzae (strain 70-15 / ATCC MYA-4617 / FGSC 8958) TaxID=242507 RepID=G4N8M2_PYRO7|nr:uncharacterized protein MGG_17099 [Pyricularia oryzae 70-15]EHA50216.1 hypothetical protein MGG_17099 [Pyricularia oryzae 70-15]